MAPVLSLASLFSGVGGLDIGFIEGERFSVRYACDIDGHARDTYKINLNHEPSSSCVNSLDSSELRGVDITLAGPPCQGFSSIGHRKTDDSRNSLIVQTAKLVARARPTLFVIENVRGLRWLSGGSYLERLCGILSSSQLRVEPVDVDCAALGLPQRRRRILIVGGIGRRGERFIAEVKRLSAVIKSPPTLVKDVLLPVPELGSLLNHGPVSRHPNWYKEVMKAIGPGQKLCDTRLGDASVHSWEIPGVFGEVSDNEVSFLLSLARLRRSEKNRPYKYIGDGRPVRLLDLAASLAFPLEATMHLARSLMAKGFIYEASDAEVDLSRRFNGRFKRLDPEGVAPAVLREYNSPRNMIHPTEQRALTVRECARLQGFCDTFEFIGPQCRQYQLVANAFPPPISRQLAKAALLAISA
jgi:DNA (cytosine-5)-methyltransferase 1